MGKPFVWVALDGLVDEEDRQLLLAHDLDKVADRGFGFKVNADWIFRVGFDSNPLQKLPSRPVFVDLKLWLGARTMTSIVCMVSDAGATATNIHALAGATNPTFQDPTNLGEFTRTVRAFKKARPASGMRLYGVTILTHYGGAYAAREYGRGLGEEVLHLADQAQKAGADGIIMPGTQLDMIDSSGFGRILKVLPGTRWEDFSDTRHEQEVHPRAVAGREDVELVCGSPITKSDDPVAALETLLAQIS